MFTTAPPVWPYSAREEVRLHLELLHRVDGRAENFRSVMPEFCSTVVTVTPSTRTSEVEFREPLATKFVLLSPRRPPDPTTPGVRYAMTHRVARDIRQRQDVFVLDHLAEVGDGGVDQRSGALNLDGGGDIADFQFRVDGRLFLNVSVKRPLENRLNPGASTVGR